MATIFENMGAKTELGSGLAAGVETLSYNQEVVFTLYVRVILPIDGYAFWVNGALLTDTAIYNATQYSKLLYDRYENPNQTIPPRQFSAKGSLHYATELRQLEERTPSFNYVSFTSLQEIQQFNAINPSLMYVANVDNFQYAFRSRENFYKQADLYHYKGHGLYSIMDTQLVDSMDQLNLSQPIVSNSLPIWLSLNQFFPMYPSFLVAQNISPPYCSVDIDPARTIALQDFPLLDPYSNPNQLVTDTVKLSIFGQNNNQALNFVQYILDYSRNTDNIGMMNMPVMQDEKETQVDFNIIAQKKIITFQVSYYQSTVNDITRKLIEHAFITVTPSTHP
jgi:hypothetical protein